MNTKIFATRLQTLRVQNNLTQKELANEISALLNGEDTISSITISSYERGSRMPIVETLITMASFFNVSLDYLTGLNELPEIDRTKKAEVRKDICIPYDIEIEFHAWSTFDKKPVYVVFPANDDTILQNRWGILDYEHKRVCFTDCMIPLKTDMKLYRYQPIDSTFTDLTNKKPLTLSQLSEHDTVWVEMQGTTDFVKGVYNGWYRHNELKNCLINVGNSCVLSYSGCGHSYNAYSL